MGRLRKWTEDVSLDAVLVAQLHMFAYVHHAWEPITVLDSHNDEASRIDGIAAVGGSWLRRLLAALQRSPVREYEDAAVSRAALTLVVSPLELQRFERIAPGRVALVPNGVDVDALQPVASPPHSRDIVVVGSLDYSANIDAVRYCASHIASRLRGRDARFSVVAAALHSEFARTLPRAIDTEVLGYVPDLDGIMRRARVFVVPLRRGGGTRLKILDAMARGIPVVSTSVGCAGIDVTSEQELLVADEPDQFSAAIDRLLTDDHLWMSVSRRARHRVEADYAWRAIGRQLDRVLEQRILRPRGSRE
jgi:glycosyltransferase involved in cell wall biosynthesis